MPGVIILVPMRCLCTKLFTDVNPAEGRNSETGSRTWAPLLFQPLSPYKVFSSQSRARSLTPHSWPRRFFPFAQLQNFLAVRNAFVGRQTDEIPFLTVEPGAVASKHVARKYFHRAVAEIGIRRPKKIVGNMTFGHPRPHSLRHSFAVNTLRDVRRRGRSAQNALPILAAYLGHTDWRYTMKYLKVIDAEHGKALVDFCVVL